MPSMGQILIRVTDDDRVLGAASKRACHTGKGLRHRAYLAMIYNPRGELLLARRNPGKWLWPGWWDGTVAGHVEKGETYGSAVRRRVFEEIGIRPRLRRVDKFAYTARYRGNGENEICAIYVGIASRVNPDRREIDAWVFSKRPAGKLVPWLELALKRKKKWKR